jgi:hypothetical protein
VHVNVPQALPAVDLRTAPRRTVKCGVGIGLAVCSALDLIVTSTYHHDSAISAYALAGPDHRLLGTWVGGEAPGPLLFDFYSGDCESGGLCFTVPAPAVGGGGGGMGAGAGGGAAAPSPLLLVASHGTRCVVVLDMSGVGSGDGAPVPAGAFGGADDPAPRCVAACAGMVAVSGWTENNPGDHTVTLHAAGTWERVWVVGAGRGSGPGDGQLDHPCGLRFSTDGARLLVADTFNHRVCCFRVSDGGFVSVVASEGTHGLDYPRDVVEVAGGVLVADWGKRRVVRVSADGSPATSELWQFGDPTTLFVSADGAQVIVRDWNTSRFHVFGDGL